MPGGVGSFVKSDLPAVKTALTVEGWSEDELRRVQAFSVFPGEGMEPIRIVQVYGYARAHDDADRMELNEAFLRKVFRECNAYGELPTVLIGDFNIEPQFSTVISQELFTGNWVDVGKKEAEARGEYPRWTFHQKDSCSRIDSCLMNGAAMHLVMGFELWEHENCTIPNHRMQCVTLRIGGKKQFATKLRKPFNVPEHKPLELDDHQFVTNLLVAQYEESLNQAFLRRDVESYWSLWSQLAEEWLLECATLSLDGEIDLRGKKFRRRGSVSLHEVVVNKKPKDLSEEGDIVDGRLAAVLKTKRILQEILTNMKKSEGISWEELYALWQKAQRIALCESRSGRLLRIWEVGPITSVWELEWLIYLLGKMVCERGTQLRRARLRLHDRLREQQLKHEPARAFKCLQPDQEEPLAVLKRQDGTLTANVKEMDDILRDKWGAIFCKHSVENPAPSVETFLMHYKEMIPVARMHVSPLTVDQIRKKLNKMSNSGEAGLDSWAPKDLKRLPRKIFKIPESFLQPCGMYGVLA